MVSVFTVSAQKQPLSYCRKLEVNRSKTKLLTVRPKNGGTKKKFELPILGPNSIEKIASDKASKMASKVASKFTWNFTI